MAILSFPAIPPNYVRSVQFSDYNTLIREFESGGEIRRSAQHTGVGTTLSLSYLLMSEDDTAVFMNFWKASGGTWLSFTLPSAIIKHPDNIKMGLANFDSTTYFRFTEGLNFKTDWATKKRGLYSFDVNIQSVVS
jgi:hypothetical protein